MTISQIVYDNELSFGYTDEEIHDKVWVNRREFSAPQLIPIPALANLGCHG